MRTIRDSKLETRAARARLPVGRKAHWRTLVPGAQAVHLGYRRNRAEEPGKWLVRRYIGAKQYRTAPPLGIADDFSDDAMSFAEAQRAALASATIPKGGANLTVADAIGTYVAWLKVHRATGDEAEGKANKLILPKLGKLRVADLTTAGLNKWRDALAETPALVRSKEGAEQRYRKPPTTADAKRARKATVNRTLTILKAALNAAFRNGLVDDDLAWRRVKPFGKVNAARPGYLTLDEAVRLINACAPEFRPLVRAALETGARYGELSTARVRDYHRGKLHIARSKSGKSRNIVLSENGVAFFDSVTVGRDRNEFLFVKSSGAPWGASEQSRPMREACERAKITPAIGVHQLRHTWASHAVMNGMPLLVVARNLGHATTIMVERHYGHLAESYVDDVIREHAPRYAVEVPVSNVRVMREA
jgi:integrase